MVDVRHLFHFAREQGGGAMVETLIVLNVIVLIIAAFVEMGLAVNQWNLAAKAAQVGARLAAVSDSVDSSLSEWSGEVTDVVEPGDPIPAGQGFADRICSGGNTSCTGGIYSADAMQHLVDRMQQVLPRLTSDNVRVAYRFTGLGYAGRPGGPVPTITVSIVDVTFDFFILGRLLGLDALRMPEFSTTIVGEDMATTYAG